MVFRVVDEMATDFLSGCPELEPNDPTWLVLLPIEFHAILALPVCMF